MRLIIIEYNSVPAHALGRGRSRLTECVGKGKIYTAFLPVVFFEVLSRYSASIVRSRGFGVIPQTGADYFVFLFRVLIN